MNFPERNDYVKYRLEKSEEAFDVAKLLVESQKWNVAVNRLYYSIFYATNALLVKRGLEAKTHAGIKTQFFLNFIKTGRIPIESGKIYSDLFD